MKRLRSLITAAKECATGDLQLSFNLRQGWEEGHFCGFFGETITIVLRYLSLMNIQVIRSADTSLVAGFSLSFWNELSLLSESIPQD